MFKETQWLMKATAIAISRPRLGRKTSNVTDEYSAGWSTYRQYLDQCESLEDWLTIKGVEDKKSYANINGKLKFQYFNSMDFNRDLLLKTIQRNFPDAQSITEFGCGIGRNLLYIKKHLPYMACFGYELCQPGVDIARLAAKRWNLDVQYNQLDYVNDEKDKYVFPASNLAFTMYSLEQLPDSNRQAMQNILQHTIDGSIHIEPVPENYPFNVRGIIGRLDHWKANYLRNFEQGLSTLGKIKIHRTALDSAHNPLMFPTLYVIKKISSSC